MRLRRSLLFVTADNAARIEKAASLPTDCVILDLEDSVAPNQKGKARETARAALQELSFGWRERLIRINALSSEWCMQDLELTVAARPDGYLLPKVEYAQQIRIFSDLLYREEHRQGWKKGSIRLLALIETAQGVLNLASIARADSRLDALILGGEDLAGSLGTRRSKEGWEIFYARSQLILAAAASSRQPIDTVFVDLADPVGLEQESLRARQLGFDGQLAIHPSQLATIRAIFTPSPQEVFEAERLVSAYQESGEAGSGVFVLDGRMVDRAVVRAAERTLEKARAAARMEDGAAPDAKGSVANRLS